MRPVLTIRWFKYDRFGLFPWALDLSLVISISHPAYSSSASFPSFPMFSSRPLNKSLPNNHRNSHAPSPSVLPAEHHCPAQRRRRGKIARLPAALRDELNDRLEDGEP